MAVTGVVGWYNIRRVIIRTELSDEIYSGVPTLVTVRLGNSKGLFPSFLIRSSLLENMVNHYIVNGRDEESDSFVHTFTGRGVHVIPGALITSPFPVNFFVRRRKIPINREFTVFPAPASMAPGDNQGGRGTKGDSSTAARGIDGEVSNISDYTGNEPMKLIHWRISAKFDDLKVKELNSAAAEPVIVEVAKLPGRDLEERLSVACHLVNRLMGSNRPVGLRLKERLISPELSRGHRLHLLTELALYDAD